MLETLAIGIGLQVGSTLLGSLFGAKKEPWRQREINRIETYDEPQSRYGEVIPRCYGKVRIQGIYVGVQIPFDWERDDYRNGQTREVELTYVYYGNLAVLWAMRPRIEDDPEIKKIWFNKQVYYRDGQIDGILGEYWGRWEGLSLTNYYGGQTEPDSMAGFLEDKITSFTNTVYTVMHRLRLNNSDGGLFDFRYPNLEAEFHTHQGTLYLSEVIADLMTGAGYDPSEFDVTELSGIQVLGFTTGVDTLADNLEQLQAVYFFEIVDTGSTLKFITQFRPAATVLLTQADLGGSDGERQGDLFTVTEDELTSLPTSIRLLYNNYGNDYQPDSKESFQIKLGDWENVQELNTTLTLNESDALTIVNRQLLLAWTRRKKYKFSVLPRFQYLEAGDVVAVELFDGEATQIQITRVNQAASGLIEIEGVAYDGSIFGLGYTAPADRQTTATITQGVAIPLGQTNIYAVNTVTNSDGTITYVEGIDYTVNLTNGTITPIVGGGISNGSDVLINFQGNPSENTGTNTPPIETTLAVIDIVKPTASDAAGLYLFADGDNPWQSATLWASDDGTNYTSQGPIYRGIFGACNTVLPDGTGIDNTSTLTVTVAETMSLPATGRVLAGAEILDYGNAVLDSSTATSRTYTLSQFNRALRDTAGTGHGSNEPFYLLSGYKFVSAITSADVGNTRYFKAVSPGQNLADVNAVSIVIAGNSLTNDGVAFADLIGFARDNDDLNAELTAIDTALNGKFNNPTGTTAEYLMGNGTPATFPTIPTLTSQLTNDSGYATQFYVNSQGFITSAALVSYATQSWVTSQGYLTSLGYGSLTTKAAVPFGGFIETITNKTYPLFKPDRSYKILSLRVKSLSGTCTWAIQIDGVNVTGLSSVSVSSVEQLVTATGTNTVTAGQRVTIVSSANSTALDVEFTIMLEVL